MTKILYNKKDSFEEILRYEPNKNSLNYLLKKSLKILIYQVEETFYSINLSTKEKYVTNEDTHFCDYLLSKPLTDKQLTYIIYNFISLKNQKSSKERLDYKEEFFSISETLNEVKKIIVSLPYESSILTLSKIMNFNIKQQEVKKFHFYVDGCLDMINNEKFRFTFDKHAKMFFIREKFPLFLSDQKKYMHYPASKIEKLISSVFENEDYQRQVFEHSLNIILRSQSQLSKTFFVFKGNPNSGKSLISNLLTLMFPFSSTWSTSTTKMSGNFENKNFIDKELLLIADSEDKISQTATEKIKKLTGGDSMEIESKFIQSCDPKPFGGSLLMTTNYDLCFPNKKIGIQERMMVIHFNNYINPLKIFEDDKSFERTSKILPKNINDIDSYIPLEEIHSYKQNILAKIELSISLNVIDQAKSKQNEFSNLSDFEPIEAFVKKFITPVEIKSKKNILLGKKKKFSSSDINDIKNVAQKDGILYKLYLSYMSTLNYEIKSKTIQKFKKELEGYFSKDNDFKNVLITRTASYNFKINNAELKIDKEIIELLLEKNI